MNAKPRRGFQLLERFEDTAGWLLGVTARWPRSARFTFARRVQDLTLETLERLVVARYDTDRRASELALVNMNLERLRILLRLAKRQDLLSARTFESAIRRIDEVGRIAHGVRTGARR
ncbi:MAG: four helix bundle protein [Planctomycetota bacterium]